MIRRNSLLRRWWGFGTGYSAKWWMPHPWNIQGQAEQGSEQPGLVEGVPLCTKGVGARWSLRFFSTQTILWFILFLAFCNFRVHCICLGEFMLFVSLFFSLKPQRALLGVSDAVYLWHTSAVLFLTVSQFNYEILWKFFCRVEVCCILLVYYYLKHTWYDRRSKKVFSTGWLERWWIILNS